MNTNTKEPAPAATDTSSNMKNEINSQHKDSILLKKSQEAIEDACKQLLNIYQDMPFEQQHAWDLGEIYAGLSRTRGELL